MPFIPTSVLLLESGDSLLQESGSLLEVERAYRGFEVLDFWPNWFGSSPVEGLEHSSTVLDNTTGLPVVRSRSSLPRGRLTLIYRVIGRAEIQRFRTMIDFIRGRGVPFWTPTWQADLQPTADITVATSTIFVQPVDYTARLYPDDSRKHIAIVNHDRVVYPRGVAAAVDNGTNEQLTVWGALPVTIPATKCMISFLLLCRLDNDSVRLRYITPTILDAELTMVEVPRETPAPSL